MDTDLFHIAFSTLLTCLVFSKNDESTLHCAIDSFISNGKSNSNKIIFCFETLFSNRLIFALGKRFKTFFQAGRNGAENRTEGAPENISKRFPLIVQKSGSREFSFYEIVFVCRFYMKNLKITSSPSKINQKNLKSSLNHRPVLPDLKN